jgi:carbon storage regulator
MLILARKLHESIIIGDKIVVSVVEIKGDQVKLGIDAPASVKVYRREVYEAIQEENRAASRSAPERIAPLSGFFGTQRSGKASPSHRNVPDERKPGPEAKPDPGNGPSGPGDPDSPTSQE